MTHARIQGYTYGTEYFEQLFGNTNPELFRNPFIPAVVQFTNAVGIHADGRTQASPKDVRRKEEAIANSLEWQVGFNSAANDALTAKGQSIYHLVQAVDAAAYKNFK